MRWSGPEAAERPDRLGPGASRPGPRRGGPLRPPYRVLQLITTLPVGGAEDLVATLVRRLDPGRFQVAVATLGPLGAVGEELAREGHPVNSLALDLKRTPFFLIVLRLRRLLRHLQPHLLHTHLYHANLYGRLAALGLGLPGIVVSVHNTYQRIKLHRCGWNFLLSFVTDRILVSSRRVWQDVRRWDRVPAAKLLILPYGVRLPEPGLPGLRDKTRAELGLAGWVVGCVARLEPQKGLPYLIEAVAALRGRIPELTLLLLGEGRERQALEELASRLEVARNLRFLGTRRDLPRLLAALDVYVQPSLWEGLPLSLLLAMGAGLPVVGTRVGGMEEVILPGHNGLLVSPGDAGALAQALLELYQQPSLGRALGEAARSTVQERYSEEAMVRRLEQLYLELLTSKGLI